MQYVNFNNASRSGARLSRHQRGNSEIELLLAIPLLLTVLFMVSATLKLGTQRLANIFQAEANSYSDTTTAWTPAYAPAANLQPITGLLSIRDGLPNRVHVADVTRTVNFTENTILPLTGKKLGDSVAFIGPPWAYSLYPNGDDADMTQQWLQDYIDESHMEFQTPLGLAQAWPP